MRHRQANRQLRGSTHMKLWLAAVLHKGIQQSQGQLQGSVSLSASRFCTSPGRVCHLRHKVWALHGRLQPGMWPRLRPDPQQPLSHLCWKSPSFGSITFAYWVIGRLA